MNDGIVDNIRARACSLLDILDVLFAFTEQVNNQRFWSFLDLINDIIDVVVRDDG